MAERRMLTKKVTDDDRFLSLSASAQALYLHLSMAADDDGFCSQVAVSMFKAHASVQDLQALLENRYIYQFESGVIVIKHWRMANALRKDRYTPTAFKEEYAKLNLKENGSYSWVPDGCHEGAVCLPQVRIGKDRLGKDRLIEESNDSSCTEPESASVLELPLNDHSVYSVTEKEITEWGSLYPAVDVLQELRNMRGWLDANPTKKKTKTGIRRFINGWLAREQDRGGSRANKTVPVSGPDHILDDVLT